MNAKTVESLAKDALGGGASPAAPDQAKAGKQENDQKRVALVLSGGSIKGAFQAGAIREVLRAGYIPEAIYGTSVGSLNGGFLAERAGRAKAQGEEPNWEDIGEELERFWSDKLASPKQVATERGLIAIAWAIYRKKFAGLIDTSPLQKLVRQELDPNNLRLTPVKFHACSINVATGEPVYATVDYSGILDYIIASTAIPIEMPVTLIGKAPYVDGGVREVAPLSRAITDGARRIICIVCQPERLQGISLGPGNLLELAFRIMEVVTNELVNNDLERFQQVNDWLKEYEAAQTGLQKIVDEAKLGQDARDQVNALLARLRGDWRSIDIDIIRPKNDIVLDLLGFDPDQIREVIQQGRNAARQVLDAESLPTSGASDRPSGDPKAIEAG